MAVACSTSVFCRSTLEEALQGVHELGFREVDLLLIDGWVHVDTTDLVKDYAGTLARVDRALKEYDLVPIAVNSGISPLLHDRSEEGCAM